MCIGLSFCVKHQLTALIRGISIVCSYLYWGRRPRDQSQSDGHRGGRAGQSECARVWWANRARGPPGVRLAAKDKESLIRGSGGRAGLIQVGKLRPWFKCTRHCEARINWKNRKTISGGRGGRQRHNRFSRQLVGGLLLPTSSSSLLALV